MQNFRTNQELVELQSEASKKLAIAKADFKAIEEEVAAANKDALEKEYTLRAKQSGSLQIQTADGLIINADIKKEVKYDSSKLQTLAATLPWEQVIRIFKITFDVPAQVYKDMSDPELKAKIDDARVVKYGDMKVVLTKAEA